MYASKGLSNIAKREKSIEAKSSGKISRNQNSMGRETEGDKKMGFDSFISRSLKLDNTMREMERKGLKKKEEEKRKSVVKA